MITRKRIMLESVLFAAAIYGGYLLFMVLQGMIQTQRYVPNPDEIRGYEQAEYLQTEVAFGMIERNSEWLAVTAVGEFILLCGLYGSIRYIWAKWRS
ncbi:hypothetical protein [Paenibacillus sp. FSL R5-808]|uniref:hypothetical protein n=1 Tax=Paenibacillus sp. FSL R5-808 TaxID=1227076 RepID=UPI0003E2C03D|nr:hypothetical protein [Paenibacillus sp. FSL R5-808]ETT34382.1 hypothetical protein C169_18529 [Paenibacillus sp. FSL R5-808]